MAADDLEKYAVVRVADEIVVDLMRSACGITYAEASSLIVRFEIEGVLIDRLDTTTLRAQVPAASAGY